MAQNRKDIGALADIAAIANMDDDEVMYRYWGDRQRVAEFLGAAGADVMTTSRINNAAASQRRPQGSSRQKMPPNVLECRDECDKVKALAPAYLESHGGVAQLTSIGWLVEGDSCVLFFTDRISFIGCVKDGYLMPLLEPTLKFKTPSDWIRHIIDDGFEVDKKDFEMINQHLNLKTYSYRFLHFPVFNNATLHQLASMYMHSSKCDGALYPATHKRSRPRPQTGAIIVRPRMRVLLDVDNARKRDRIEAEPELLEAPEEEDLPAPSGGAPKLTRDDVMQMFTTDVAPMLDLDSVIHRDLQKQIMYLNIKLSAFHQLFMALNQF
jgi:hypothetical protein